MARQCRQADPLLHRFYEMAMVNGRRSARNSAAPSCRRSDFDLELDWLRHPTGDGVRPLMSGKTLPHKRPDDRLFPDMIWLASYWANRRGANSAKAYIHTMSVATEHNVVIETVAATSDSSQRYSPARI